MTLTSKKYERIYSKTGSDADLISTDDFNDMKDDFDNNHYLNDISQRKVLGPVLYQLQQMQDEIDYLRTEILNNKNKTGITSSQANAITANTAKKGITSSQESAITANTAKTSFPGLGRTSTTALAGDTKLVFLGANTTYGFSDLIDNRGNFSIRVSATRDFGRGPVTKSIDLRLV